MSKEYLFKVFASCSGDGPAISEFVNYKNKIKEATGKNPVMVSVSHYPIFGIVRGIKYTLEKKDE